MSTVLSRTTSGLVFQDSTFSLSNGWGTGGTYWLSGSNPGFVVFRGVGITNNGATHCALAGTAAGLDAEGCREVIPYAESGTWYLFYDSNDGSAGSTGATNATGNIRPYYATSTDRGLTWTKNGYVLSNSGLAIGGAETTLNYRALGYMAKWGSTYVLYPIYGYSATAPPNGIGTIPAPPYPTDVWTASSLSGPWTYANATPGLGGSGAFDQGGAYASCVVSDGTNLNMFYGSAAAPYSAPWGVGLAQTPVGTPAGPYSKVGGGGSGASVFSSGLSYLAENPRVWYWPVLGCYVMTFNGQNPGGFACDTNFYYLSNSLTNWTSLVDGPIIFQHVSTVLNGAQADGANTLGIFGPMFGPGGLPIIDSNGYIPCVYDGFGAATAAGSSSTNAATQHRLIYAVAEPSPNALAYTWTSGADSGSYYQRSDSTANFIVEFAFDYKNANSNANTGARFDYRIQASGDRYALATSLNTGSPGGLYLYKSTGGSGGNPGTFSLVQAYTTNSAVNLFSVGQSFRILLSVNGTTHTAYLNGELQISVTDPTYTTSTGYAFQAGQTTARFRLFHMRTGQNVTVTGLTNGQTITFRAPGGIPVETGTVSGSSYTTSGIVHYPISEIDIAGLNYSPGLIWGGDTWNLTTVAGGNFRRRRR